MAPRVGDGVGGWHRTLRPIDTARRLPAGSPSTPTPGSTRTTSRASSGSAATALAGHCRSSASRRCPTDGWPTGCSGPLRRGRHISSSPPSPSSVASRRLSRLPGPTSSAPSASSLPTPGFVPAPAGPRTLLPAGARASSPPPCPPAHPLGRASSAHLPARRPHLPAPRRHSPRRRPRPPFRHRPGHPRAPAASLQAPPPRPGHLPAPAWVLVRCSPSLETPARLTMGTGVLHPQRREHPQELLRPESRRASSAQRPGLHPVCAAKTRFVLPWTFRQPRPAPSGPATRVPCPGLRHESPVCSSLDLEPAMAASRLVVRARGG